ncbi:hypothetical protein Glove_372g91 [Diversispora epigaea]|uniref:Uncharacterized protein n=1 Tax=Diversispora epigaea TaxID=1348612 RepID=A0A397HDY7_9GLOM|nr:hypothetical protein Glove_372g91 [Diversispora epigaea]
MSKPKDNRYVQITNSDACIKLVGGDLRSWSMKSIPPDKFCLEFLSKYLLNLPNSNSNYLANSTLFLLDTGRGLDFGEVDREGSRGGGRGRTKNLNLVVEESVYEDKNGDKVEYRVRNPFRSKLAAGILDDLDIFINRKYYSSRDENNNNDNNISSSGNNNNIGIIGNNLQLPEKELKL